MAKGQTAAQPLQKGAKLSEGDRIRTGKGGVAEVVLGDGSLVRVGELSDLEIDKLDVDATNQPTTSRFNLAAGQARAWVARQVVAKVGTGTGRFSVTSPTAVAAVRQTDFALADGRVYTFAGVVETRNTDPSIPGIRPVRAEPVHARSRPQASPTDCQVIPLRDKRRLLSPDGLAVEGVFLEPNNLDNVAIGVLGDKLISREDDRNLDVRWPGRQPQTGRTPASEGQALTDVDVIVK